MPINQDINQRVRVSMDQMNDSLKDRVAVIHGAWVGRIAQLHVLMRGPGGTGKSMLQRTMCDHISDSIPFEVAFDETTDPSQVFGPPDLKGMAEEGVTRRITTGMLPEATDAFADEFFNGNIPLLHSLQPPLNERLFHNAGMPTHIPLRQCIMGTNKLNLEPDLMPLFDRVHIRYDVGYVSDRSLKKQMLENAVARLAGKGRGAVTDAVLDLATVTVAELDQAFEESLHLDMPESVFELFLDIIEELGSQGVTISDRRQVDGMNAVLANAWLRNHEEVQSGDLDILSAMFWSTEEDISTSKSVILAAASPGEKKAYDLLDDLDKIKAEVRATEGDDEERARRVSVEAVRNVEKVLREAETERDNTRAAGGSTLKLDEVINKADAFKIDVAKKIFGLGADDLAKMGA